MDYLKKNKDLLINYLLIIISNILLYIFCGFYLKNFEYASIIMFLLIVIVGLIIYNFRNCIKFKIYLDIICCVLLGFVMMFFENKPIMYSYNLFNMFFANNIVFMLSRKSEKYFKRVLQYILIIVIAILCMLINLFVYFAINGT